MARQQYSPSTGGRPKSLPDHVELLVARRLGRDLTTAEGGLVQIVTLLAFGAIFCGLVWWAFTAGFVIGVVREISK